MDDKDLELLEEDTIEALEELDKMEDTKEVKTLMDLSLEALQSVASSYLEELEEPVEEEQVFEEVVEQKEEKMSEPNTKEKENFVEKMKKKWQQLSKKQKGFVIAGIVLFLILFISLICLFLFGGSDEDAPAPGPDVVLKGDNYRYENGKLIFLDDDKELGTYECKNKDEKKCAVAYVSSDEILDGVRRVDETNKPLQLRSDIYNDRYVFIIDRENTSDDDVLLYDMKEEKVLKTVYGVLSYPEYKNYVVLKDETGNVGLEKIEEEVSTVIPYTYDYIGLLPNQETLANIVVKDKSENFYLADLENKILTKSTTNTIVGANKEYYKTKDASNKYHIFERSTGNEVISNILPDYATLLDNYIIYVKNEKLFVVDYQGHPMNLEGYELYNDHFNVKETYKDLKLQKTEKAFDYELSEGNITIKRYDREDEEEIRYNLYEGMLSAKIPYMSYFDGSLILYSDEEKTKEIGAYSCKNKNEINKDTKELTKCNIAKDSFYHEIRGNSYEIDESDRVGAIPVANKKYIFIQDGNQIVLYDLEEKKEIALYESVDTSSYTNSNDVMFATPKDMHFIAKSASSKKFGVASITTDGVKSILKFEYESIKKLGDYYVVQTSEGYKLYQLDGTPVEMEFKKNPIVDYHGSYLKTLNGENYYVHSFTKDYNSSYNYVVLYDEFYAGVINNRVHLYRYDDEEKQDYIYDETEEKEGLALNEKDYEKAFTITISGETINVQIADTTGTMRPYTFSTRINNQPSDDDTSSNTDDENPNDEDENEGDEEDES